MVPFIWVGAARVRVEGRRIVRAVLVFEGDEKFKPSDPRLVGGTRSDRGLVKKPSDGSGLNNGVGGFKMFDAGEIELDTME